MFLDSLKYSFGLDISDYSLKVVALEQFQIHKKLITQINSWGEQILPDNTVVNGEIKKIDVFVQNLNNLLQHKAYKKIRTNIAVVSIPEHKMFLKLVAYDEGGAKNITTGIEKLIQAHVPEDLKNLTYDYQIIAQNNLVQVLIGATFKDTATNYFVALEKAKILPLAFEPETVANCNSVIPENTSMDEFNAILDIGSTYSSLVITRGTLPLMSLTIPFSENYLNATLAQKLGLSYNEAEKLVLRCGFDMKACEISLQKILANIINELNLKVQKAFTAMINELKLKGRGKIKIQHLWLVGGGATLRKLDTTLSAEFGMTVRVGNPYINLGVLRGKSLPDNPAKYATAIGLAMVNPKNIPRMNHI